MADAVRLGPGSLPRCARDPSGRHGGRGRSARSAPSGSIGTVQSRRLAHRRVALGAVGGARGLAVVSGRVSSRASTTSRPSSRTTGTINRTQYEAQPCHPRPVGAGAAAGTPGTSGSGPGSSAVRSPTAR